MGHRRPGPSRRWSAAPGLLAAARLLAAGATAEAAFRPFRSSPGRVRCAFGSDSGTPPAVRCDWRGGYGEAVTVGETGRAGRVRVSDGHVEPRAKVVAYGASLRFHRLSRRSRRTATT